MPRKRATTAGVFIPEQLPNLRGTRAAGATPTSPSPTALHPALRQPYRRMARNHGENQRPARQPREGARRAWASCAASSPERCHALIRPAAPWKAPLACRLHLDRLRAQRLSQGGHSSQTFRGRSRTSRPPRAQITLGGKRRARGNLQRNTQMLRRPRGLGKAVTRPQEPRRPGAFPWRGRQRPTKALKAQPWMTLRLCAAETKAKAELRTA